MAGLYGWPEAGARCQARQSGNRNIEKSNAGIDGDNYRGKCGAWLLVDLAVMK